MAIIDGSFRWNRAGSEDRNASQPLTTHIHTGSSPARHDFELSDINVVFPDGEITLVTGPTASGKTALLMALLGELTTLRGRVVMSKDSSRVDRHGLLRTFSYAAQTPCLHHQSIKDNIRFDFPFYEDRYKAVLESCALLPDMEMLEDGDSTEICAR